MGKKVSATERAEALRAVYKLAEKNKGEDRLTQSDIKQAKKVLNYKEPKKAADYGAIKDYGELSKGGQIKPVKAVAGVLAGMAAGIAPGIIGLGYMANKRAKKKAKATAQAQAGMAESTIQPIRTLNRGGGMDMGKKNKYAKKNSKKLFGYEFTDEAQPGYTVTKKMNKGGGMDMGHKPRPRGNPGVVETVVGKGGDYIKDLIN